jgi:glycerophosphoryl diester phosphodiesterase
VSTPFLVAHRGGSAEAPENTLAAFRRALALGIRWFELDVQSSRDGALVVIHDTTVDRTTDGTGEVGSLLFEELRRLDAGAWFDPQYRGERIPTLREMLELCAEAGAGVAIELKSPHLYPGIEQKVTSLLAEMWVHGGGGPDVLCISFDSSSIARLHSLDPALPLGQLYLPDTQDFAQADDTVQATLPHFSLAARHPEQVARAHALGKRIFVWTVNEPDDMRQMAALGVDGIVSDRPSLLLETL